MIRAVLGDSDSVAVGEVVFCPAVGAVSVEIAGELLSLLTMSIDGGGRPMVRGAYCKEHYAQCWLSPPKRTEKPFVLHKQSQD